jgi:hypothetical protein
MSGEKDHEIFPVLEDSRSTIDFAPVFVNARGWVDGYYSKRFLQELMIWLQFSKKCEKMG